MTGAARAPLANFNVFVDGLRQAKPKRRPTGDRGSAGPLGRRFGVGRRGLVRRLESEQFRNQWDGDRRPGGRSHRPIRLAKRVLQRLQQRGAGRPAWLDVQRSDFLIINTTSGSADLGAGALHLNECCNTGVTGGGGAMASTTITGLTAGRPSTSASATGATTARTTARQPIPHSQETTIFS
jgi:hypothetical protein